MTPLAFLEYHSAGLLCAVLIGVAIAWLYAEEMDL